MQYVFGGIIGIKYFYPKNIKIDEKSYKNILIYYFEYLMIKDSKYIKVNSVKSLISYFQQI